MSTSISMPLLARMERILRYRIGAKKEGGIKYDFQVMKHEVLFEHRGDIHDEAERKKYSSELSRRFGIEGGKAGKGKKRCKKKPAKKRKAVLLKSGSLNYNNPEFKRHMEAL